MATGNPLPGYSPGVAPTLDGGDREYLRNELNKISTSLTAVIRLTPQVATKAPSTPVDGMIRLARAPWRPVSGQTVDQWVYYDGVASAWRLLGTAPTTKP